ncbi:riboflavin synthase [Fundicoccus ignavus]|uniref:Riboflavin synthase n=1 Tax=Fundicoccus ignavus TaxID=2664442 RepID=A0A844BWJ5_9LACT|nr:riboflavin synthase [Fundicoccus ignavus]MRJ46308.1 riboflavin synthase [Fundicoccus ignavus]
MFTGIIEEIGKIKGIKKGENSSVLTIEAKNVLDGTIIGDSISVNGVCLTVTDLLSTTFQVDVMAETLNRSNIGQLIPGQELNLERALTMEKRLGGHIVSGHIDGTGTIQNYREDDNTVWVTIATSPDLLRYVIEKGSIAIDGISLTVAGVDESSFEVAIIPHTAEKTILLKKEVGDTVNLEYDMIGKYVEKLLGFVNPSNPTKS